MTLDHAPGWSCALFVGVLDASLALISLYLQTVVLELEGVNDGWTAHEFGSTPISSMSSFKSSGATCSCSLLPPSLPHILALIPFRPQRSLCTIHTSSDHLSWCSSSRSSASRTFSIYPLMFFSSCSIASLRTLEFCIELLVLTIFCPGADERG